MNGPSPIPVRVLIATADREVERRLVRELPASGITIVGRCLDAPTLLERADEPGIDVVLASTDLHRLNDATLVALRERRLPVVLLTTDAAEAARLASLAHLLPASSSAAVVAAAVRQAEAHGAIRALAAANAGPPPAEGASGGPGHVLAVVSGKGAPGKTTVAIALAALFASEPARVVLVDADLRGGNVAPYLDLDPRRGLVGLVAPDGSLGDELQDGPGFAVLAGVERPELAAALREETLTALVTALRARFDTVVVDLGVPAEPAVLRAVDEVLLVTGADLVSVWNTRLGLRAIREGAGGAPLSVVLNRCEGREHYGADEVARALGSPVLAAVREDRKAARRAAARQVPLSAAGGRVARDLAALASALKSRQQAPMLPDRAPAALVPER